VGVQDVAGAKPTKFCHLKLCAVLTTTNSRSHSRAVIVSVIREEIQHQPLMFMICNTLSSSVERSSRRGWHLVQERKAVGTAVETRDCMCHNT